MSSIHPRKLPKTNAFGVDARMEPAEVAGNGTILGKRKWMGASRDSRNNGRRSCPIQAGAFKSAGQNLRGFACRAKPLWVLAYGF
jgi:hypothetical protein